MQEPPAERVLPDIEPDFKITNEQDLSIQTSDAIGSETATNYFRHKFLLLLLVCYFYNF